MRSGHGKNYEHGYSFQFPGRDNKMKKGGDPSGDYGKEKTTVTGGKTDSDQLRNTRKGWDQPY